MFWGRSGSSGMVSRILPVLRFLVGSENALRGLGGSAGCVFCGSLGGPGHLWLMAILWGSCCPACSGELWGALGLWRTTKNPQAQLERQNQSLQMPKTQKVKDNR